MDKIYKILFLKDGMEKGGTTTSFIALLDALSMQHKYKISVWINSYDEHNFYQLPQNINLYKNKYIEDSFAIPQNRILRIWNIITIGTFLPYVKARKIRNILPNSRKVIELYQIIDSRRAKKSKKVDLREFDIVISWEEFFPCYFLAETVICKRKIAWIHPDYKQCGFNPDIDRNVFGKIDAIVAVSKTGQKNMMQYFPEMSSKIWGIYNCINAMSIRKESKKKQSEIESYNGLTLVTVARLQNISKAYDRAVEIAYRLKNEFINFRWYFIGDGEDRQIIEQRIEKRGLEGIVILLGSKNNPYPYMAAADLFILQSYYEGKPMVVDEAMIVGTPVLVTDYASAKEQVNPKYGWIVKNNEDSIFNMLKQILKSPAYLQEKRNNLLSMDTEKYFGAVRYLKLFDKVMKSDCEIY